MSLHTFDPLFVSKKRKGPGGDAVEEENAAPKVQEEEEEMEVEESTPTQVNSVTIIVLVNAILFCLCMTQNFILTLLCL